MKRMLLNIVWAWVVLNGCPMQSHAHIESRNITVRQVVVFAITLVAICMMALLCPIYLLQFAVAVVR